MYLIAILFLCAVVFFYGLGRAPFVGPDEPRYAEVAREMYLSGDWVTPRLGGIGWFEKPALTYWLLAVGYTLFGENEFAARFGIAAVATFGALLLYIFGRRAHSARFGYLSASVLVTCGLWLGFARAVTCDLTLSVTIQTALLSFFLWESKESRVGTDRLWYVFCFALGLATLAKGLVGVVLPAMIIAPYLILTGAWKSLLKPRMIVPIIVGALIFLATAAVWYAPVIARNGGVFINEFFVGHHFQRYLSNKYRHPQPVYFFSLVAVAGSFPWSFYLLSFLARQDFWVSLKRWRQASSEKTPDDLLQVFLLLWIVAPVVFFSFSGSKLPGYILPIFPAVALITGRELERWWGDESRIPKAKALGHLTAALVAAAGIAAAPLLQRELGVSARGAWLLGSVAVLAPAIYLGLLFFKSGRVATLYLPIGLALIVATATHMVFPSLGNRESLKSLSLAALHSARDSERLAFFINNDQGINFYAPGLPLRDGRSELVITRSAEEIAALAEAGRSQSVLIMTPMRWYDGLMNSPVLRVEKIGEQSFNVTCSPDCDWVLLRAQSSAAAARP
ncbi:MAG: glycosyltransferase family 39 protein [Blastocatellia bacterium]|nr:glycosyltransferase family 39 protein [Blastocatellia bacterium]